MLHHFTPSYIPTYIHTYLHTYLPTYQPTYLHTYIPTYNYNSSSPLEPIQIFIHHLLLKSSMVLVRFLCNPNALGSIRSDVNIFFILQIDEFEGIEEIMKKKRVGKVIFEMMSSSSSTTVTMVKSTFARHSQNKIQRRCVVHRLTFLPCSISCFKFQMRPSRNLNMCARKLRCQ